MVDDELQDGQEVARYEVLRSCANRMMWTIDLQMQRLRDVANRLDLDKFALRPVSDAEFLILCLHRLLGAARRINEIADGAAIAAAIAAFEQALPNLSAARNIISHIDEYLSGVGNNKSVSVGSLGSNVLDPDRISFAHYEFDLKQGFAAAERLFEAIRANPPPSYLRAVALAESRSE